MISKPMDRLRLLVTGGGTGGHISPGIAVIEALRMRSQGMRVLWVGVRGRREEDIVPRSQIPLRTIRLSGLERSIKPTAILRNIGTAVNWITLLPILKARRIIQEFEPDFILGTGGYACAPVIIAARWLGVRCWLLEQNSVPGLTVRWLSRIVDGVGIAYENTRWMLPKNIRIETVGNPISRSVLSTTHEEGIDEFNLDPFLKTLLVIGGSLGSETLNRAVRELLEISSDGQAYAGWQILHSVGQHKYEHYMRNLRATPNYHPLPYIYRSDAALAAADLVLCRGGAMTLAEITARGVPSIIVPWPGAVRNHQYTNARTLADSGAAILYLDKEISGIKVASVLRELGDSPERLERMGKQSRLLGKPDAADRVANLILSGETH